MKPTPTSPHIEAMASRLLGLAEKRTNVKQEIAREIATETDHRIWSVYPAIIDTAFAQTMSNYRKYVADYNQKTKVENLLIDKHNSLVELHRKNNELQPNIKQNLIVFSLKNKHLPARQYNQLADEMYNSNAPMIEKRRIPTIKGHTELVFQNMLHLYNSQLMKTNAYYETLNLKTSRPLQPLVINAHLVARLKRDNVRSVNLCTKSIRTHRQRLQEAGVFLEEDFKIKFNGVEVAINPQILVVLDYYNTKNPTAENQPLSPRGRKELPDTNDSTKALLNEFEKKENVNNSQDRSSLTLTGFYLSFTKTPPSKEENSTGGAAAENVKISNTLSTSLESRILHPQDLAVKLANHEYDNYQPIDIRLIYREAYSGTMSADDFRELVIQEVFKNAARIWKDKTAFAGSWKKAINQYMKSKWITPDDYAWSKPNIASDLQQMRWRINWACRWFLKNDFPPLFPFEYFDKTRKTAKEVGFEYTKQKWNQKEAAFEKYTSLEAEQRRKARKRKVAISESRKFELAFKRFFSDKMTWPALCQYVEKNLGPQYMAKLPEAVNKYALKYTQKHILLDQKQFQIKYSQFEL